MKKRTMLAFLVLVPVIMLLYVNYAGDSLDAPGSNNTAQTQIHQNSGTGITTKFSTAAKNSTGFTPYDFTKGAGVSPQSKKKYTIMVYMNGSDLESMYAAATGDIKEMAASKFDDKNINLLLFTGGCEKWHTKGIPDKVNTVFQMKNGRLIRLANAGKESMGEPEVLGGFIRFGVELFPAEKFGLILWNHGGGAVVGYGADERYEYNPEKAVMKLTDIDAALSVLGGGKKLEFLGFDTCLMSTLEMAGIAHKYAEYMVASEEVEPEQGWNYGFLKEIAPNSTGYDIGKLAVDYYRDYYEETGLGDFITLSVTNLSKIPSVTEAFENFAAAAGDSLNSGNFNLISRARSRTRSFGSGGEDGETDMVDILEMASAVNYLFPVEAKELAARIGDCVEYKYESWEEHTGGLSVYYPFYNKENLEYNIEIYKSMNQLPNYTSFINDFSAMLNQKPVISFFGSASLKPITRNHSGTQLNLTEGQTEFLSNVRVSSWKEINGPENNNEGFFIQVGDNPDVVINSGGSLSYENKLFKLNGYYACLYDTNNSSVKRYTIPVTHNGQDANLIAVFCENYPEGRVIGAIPTDNNVFNSIDKKLVAVKDGDKIAMRYYSVVFGDKNGRGNQTTDAREMETWYVGEEFVVDGGFVLEETSFEGVVQKLNLIDTQNNNHYVDLP